MGVNSLSGWWTVKGGGGGWGAAEDIALTHFLLHHT